ncbi:MAG: D-glycero-alpha-D-manno-heptose-1,7-bisphosphate 7-phosphatase [Limisphaerales bacterium]
MNRAVFLDRDGVLIEDVHLLTRPDQIRVLPGVPDALRGIAAAGFRLVVITNQTVVARGLSTEAEVDQVHAELNQSLQDAGAPPIERFYVCPHHPAANLPAYRVACDCRKPAPGLILRAARDFDLSLPACFTVGDRITDIHAGARAGTRTVLVQTGRHRDPAIESVDPLDPKVQSDRVCPDLNAAAAWILSAPAVGTRA